MNYRRVVHILGLVVLILAGTLLVPLVFAFGDASHGHAIFAFTLTSLCTSLVGVAMRRIGSNAGELYRREGVLIVVGSWLLASVIGAVPYVASGAIPGWLDALFESASGFTTTGASILVDIESVDPALLFWRSLTQWLGGIGIVVLFVALLSELGPGARFLFKLEVPGPKAEILHTRVQETASALLRIYLGLSALEVVILLLLGLDLYDALTHTFATVSTGGFSPYSDSVAHFDPAVQVVVLVFMLAAGVNFSLYYALVRKRDPGVFRDSEFRLYALIFLLTSAAISADLFVHERFEGAQQVLDAAFQVASILTTTGYATADFDGWPSVSRAALVFLMIAGGCAGSTAGGAKLVRAIIGARAALREVRLTFSPNAVIAVVVGESPVPEESVRSVAGLLLLWGAVWVLGTLLLSVGDTDLASAATASMATLSNIGPGLGAVGPTQNFAFFAGWQKGLMVVLMLLGRLEFFALLAILIPRFWRR